MVKSEDIMPAGTRRRYTEAFKLEAVRLVRESARPVAQVARELGIPDNVLYRWTAQHRQAAAHGTSPGAQRAERDELTTAAIPSGACAERLPCHLPGSMPGTHGPRVRGVRPTALFSQTSG